MREIIGAAFVSMDGVMQAPGNPDEDPSGGFPHGGWLGPVADEALGNQVGTLFHQPFDLLLGRRTYEIFAAYWPYMPAEHWVAAAFARARKYVLSHRELDPAWAGSERLADVDDLARLTTSDGPPLVIQGSASLYPQLLERDLIDRLVVMTAPVLLGRGKRLFGDGTPPGSWRLAEHRVSAGGMAMATYARAGTLQTSRIGPDDPSPAELARRARWAAQG
jgi:dihydrofolate reductase